MLFLLLISTLASAGDIDKIVGKYQYDQYRLWFRDGRVLSLANLGARSATLEIKSDDTLTLNMQMSDGKTIVETATIKQLKIKGNRGYMLAQWPNMNYPVKKNFTLGKNSIRYTIRFEDKSDTARFGSVEEAVLEKVSLK